MYDCALGDGVTDFRYCFEKLKQAGYHDDISLEFEGNDEEIRRNVDFLKNMIKEVYADEI